MKGLASIVLKFKPEVSCTVCGISAYSDTYTVQTKNIPINRMEELLREAMSVPLINPPLGWAIYGGHYKCQTCKT